MRWSIVEGIMDDACGEAVHLPWTGTVPDRGPGAFPIVNQDHGVLYCNSYTPICRYVATLPV